MKINIFGLGYVGCVTAVSLARYGHTVTGIDIDPIKVELINKGKGPVIEPKLEEYLAAAFAEGKIRATTNNIDSKEIGSADISFVCVGTPSNENSSLNLNFMKKVVSEIGEYLKNIETYHVINIRSTVLPGTIEEVVIPIIEKFSGKSAGKDFGICMNPEFLREGTAMQDFLNPPFTIIGEFDSKSGDIVSGLYDDIEAPLFRTDIKVAEMLKYSCNAFHALKVSFANEIGNICKQSKIDSHEVMSLFCQDTQLNLSSYYLKPGFAFGGSCLPKDLRALLYMAKMSDVETPVLSSIIPSNKMQIDIAFNLIRKTKMKKVGVVGLSFKAGTDDLRESPMVDLIETLIGKGYSLTIYDEEVSIAKIFGANKKYIETVIPHISTLMNNSLVEVIENSDVIVFGNKSEIDKEILGKINKNKYVIDLARIINLNTKGLEGCYEGICW
jgi:GDP-mannose 6-dehydrogenase